VRAVNLIPLDQRGGAGPAAGASQGGAYAVPVVLAGLVIMTLFYGSARHDISKRQAQVASVTAATQRAEASTSQLTSYANFLKLREERQAAVSTLAESRFDWAYAFQEIGRVLPTDASILSLTGSVGAPTTTASPAATTGKSSVASATPPGSVPTFVLSGCATSQTEVAQTLDRLRLIDGVSQVTLQSSTKPASGTSGGGGCLGSDPTFNLTVFFEPLPTPPSAPKTSTGGAG